MKGFGPVFSQGFSSLLSHSCCLWSQFAPDSHKRLCACIKCSMWYGKKGLKEQTQMKFVLGIILSERFEDEKYSLRSGNCQTYQFKRKKKVWNQEKTILLCTVRHNIQERHVDKKKRNHVTLWFWYVKTRLRIVHHCHHQSTRLEISCQSKTSFWLNQQSLMFSRNYFALRSAVARNLVMYYWFATENWDRADQSNHRYFHGE